MTKPDPSTGFRSEGVSPVLVVALALLGTEIATTAFLMVSAISAIASDDPLVPGTGVIGGAVGTVIANVGDAVGASTIDMLCPPSEPYTKGSCLRPVLSSTWSR